LLEASNLAALMNVAGFAAFSAEIVARDVRELQEGVCALQKVPAAWPEE
jgi:hypothetical protein